MAIAVGSGASNAEVAALLFMSEATVKAHVSRLFAKLDVANRVRSRSSSWERPRVGWVRRRMFYRKMR